MPNNNIVDADDRRAERRAASHQTERVDRGLALAAIVQAIPWFIWAAPLVLLFGFIGMAVWFNREGHALKNFTSSVLGWLALVPVVAGVVLIILGARWCYRFYNQYMLDASTRRVARAGVTKAVAAARAQELKNDQLQAKIDLEKQLPYMMQWALQNGYHAKYGKEGLEIYQAQGVRISEPGVNQGQLGVGATAAIAGPADDLPTEVMYEDVRGQVPRGHILVGVGRAGKVETKERAVGACVWIVGLSGTGKTSTTVLRVEERHADGHGFLGVDPHWYKDDSLYHAICETLDGQPLPYARHFVKPMARTPEEAKVVLQAFLDEFNGRKSGRIPRSQWRPLTLLVDEVGSLMDPTTPEEEEIAKMLPTIARVCGQEARNFLMGGIFISQQATGLAWLRKMALMVIVHQLLMQNEKELAVNGDKATAKAMESWPVGRTYVYGVGFQEGPRTVQQPYFKSPDADGDDFTFEDEDESDSVEPSVAAVVPGGEEQEQSVSPPVPALTGDMRKVYDAALELLDRGERVSSRAIEPMTGIKKDKANGILEKLENLGYLPRRKAV